MRIQRIGILGPLKFPRLGNSLRTFTILALVFLATVGAECPSGDVSPAGTGHESRIVVGLAGKYIEHADVFVNGQQIGSIVTGETVSSPVLTPGNHTVSIVSRNNQNVSWPTKTVELKENTNYSVTYSTDPGTIRATLGAECIGEISNGSILVEGETVHHQILPGGQVIREDKKAGKYTITIFDGANIRGAQTVTVQYAATVTANFGC